MLANRIPTSSFNRSVYHLPYLILIILDIAMYVYWCMLRDCMCIHIKYCWSVSISDVSHFVSFIMLVGSIHHAWVIVGISDLYYTYDVYFDLCFIIVRVSFGSVFGFAESLVCFRFSSNRKVYSYVYAYVCALMWCLRVCGMFVCVYIRMIKCVCEWGWSNHHMRVSIETQSGLCSFLITQKLEY